MYMQSSNTPLVYAHLKMVHYSSEVYLRVKNWFGSEVQCLLIRYLKSSVSG